MTGQQLRIVCTILSTLALSSCQGWTAINLSEVGPTQAIRVTTADGAQIGVLDPTISGDSLLTGRGSVNGEPVSLPVDGITLIERHGVSASGTTQLFSIAVLVGGLVYFFTNFELR